MAIRRSKGTDECSAGELYQLQSDWMLKRMTEEFQHFVLSVSYIYGIVNMMMKMCEKYGLFIVKAVC